LLRNKTIKKEIRNGCLVIVPCRVGMSKVDPEYIDAIRFIFFYPNITMGAMGGKPG
jgi:hypothetical protein